MKLVKSLGVKYKEVISLVGGGGKTTLMFALAKEFSLKYPGVITTTTTKILEPSSTETEELILETDQDRLVEIVERKITGHRVITVASELASGKLRGVSPETVDRLIALNGVSCVIVEADGAAQKPIKAPNDTEPVFPGVTTLAIPVIGVDAIGKTVKDIVFRPEIACSLLGVTGDTVVTPRVVADLLAHSRGILKGCPPSARVIPFINKMDLDPDRIVGGQIALEIISHRIPEVKMVVLGQANRLESHIISVYI